MAVAKVSETALNTRRGLLSCSLQIRNIAHWLHSEAVALEAGEGNSASMARLASTLAVRLREAAERAPATRPTRES